MKLEHWLHSLAIVVALSGGAVYAQDLTTDVETTSDFAATAFQEPTTPMGTLPPIEVRPAPDAPAEPSEATEEETGPFDLSQSYRSLSEQLFDNNFGSSSIRGINRSVFDLPNNGTIVDRENIREKQATTILQALQNEVGVMVQQTGRGQSSIFLRGVTGQQVLILVDGIRVNNSALRGGPNQYSSLFDPGSIDRIEVIRGSQSTMWGGDAIGGVVNIVTLSANPNRGN